MVFALLISLLYLFDWLVDGKSQWINKSTEKQTYKKKKLLQSQLVNINQHFIRYSIIRSQIQLNHAHNRRTNGLDGLLKDLRDCKR